VSSSDRKKWGEGPIKGDTHSGISRGEYLVGRRKVRVSDKKVKGASVGLSVIRRAGNAAPEFGNKSNAHRETTFLPDKDEVIPRWGGTSIIDREGKKYRGRGEQCALTSEDVHFPERKREEDGQRRLF